MSLAEGGGGETRTGRSRSSPRDIARPYVEPVEQPAQFQGVVQRYFRLLDIYQKHGVTSVEVILPRVKDPIPRR